MSAVSRPSSFDPAHIKILACAFEQAWSSYCQGEQVTKKEWKVFRDALARRIMQLGQDGEHDQDILVAGGLAHLSFLRPRGGLPSGSRS